MFAEGRPQLGRAVDPFGDRPAGDARQRLVGVRLGHHWPVRTPQLGDNPPRLAQPAPAFRVPESIRELRTRQVPDAALHAQQVVAEPDRQQAAGDQHDLGPGFALGQDPTPDRALVAQQITDHAALVVERRRPHRAVSCDAQPLPDRRGVLGVDQAQQIAHSLDRHLVRHPDPLLAGP
ncbi:hypothetical protein DN069_19930 [Streptacidiphilus pinicola]|uniref:Uncharacterized protein n=1 Tax=Streptacidiphilus pinicola TaxID=2219663 RepID=A0A2X0J0Z9_9ACTN|nr:hypothetical protein [Streptacidiphilus pinicola]RAG83876.1 hypothetical protein DN069_19930 [Streptacidiphilus pinicola]